MYLYNCTSCKYTLFYTDQPNFKALFEQNQHKYFTTYQFTSRFFVEVKKKL